MTLPIERSSFNVGITTATVSIATLARLSCAWSLVAATPFKAYSRKTANLTVIFYVDAHVAILVKRLCSGRYISCCNIHVSHPPNVGLSWIEMSQVTSGALTQLSKGTTICARAN